MRNNIDGVLALGIILNFVNLLLRHLGVYEFFKLPDSIRGFLTGTVAALLLLGLVRQGLGPERLAACKQWFIHLLGG